MKSMIPEILWFVFGAFAMFLFFNSYLRNKIEASYLKDLTDFKKQLKEKMNISIDSKDFKDLISGKIIKKDFVNIALSDIGFQNMIEIIEEVESEARKLET